MNRQPRLEGERLRLRPLAETDREALYVVAADPALWALHPAHDRWQWPVFDAMFDEALSQGGALAVVERASGAIIGSSQFRPSARVPCAVEIGWTFLARAHWGGGANRELKRLMLGHALGQVGRAVFRVAETNLRSRRAMEKVGARLLDLDEDVAFPDGRTVRHVVYEIDREAFAAGPLVNP